MTKLNKDQVSKAAGALFDAYRTGAACAPLTDTLTDWTLEDAYAVQAVNTDRWLAEGRHLSGRKIGLTAKAVQAQLGVDQPDFGMLFADMAYCDGEDVPVSRLLQPKVEGEIAFVLGRDLASEHLTITDVMGAVEYCVAAIEVVDSRVADWKIKIFDTIADNASSGLYVLGTTPKKLDQVDFRLCGMVMEHRGEPVSTGAGLACLGNPLNATLWLARKMVAVGRPLKAGDTILSGALGPMVPAAAGESYEVRINGLGSVRARFTQE